MGRKIVILGVGGTIAGTGPAGGDSYMAAQLSAEQLVGSIPALKSAAGGELQV